MSAHGAPRRDAAATVAGERGAALVDRRRSVASRASNVLALALVAALGLALLAWYYGKAFSRPVRTTREAKAVVASRADSEMALPSLGRIDPPPSAPASRAEAAPPAASPPLVTVPADDAALGPAPAQTAASKNAAPAAASSTVAAAKTPAELALERRLSGPAFSRQADTSGAVASVERAPASAPPTQGGSSASADLAEWLTPTTAPAVSARVLSGQRLLLPRGAFIDCTLETAIDSSLPGMTTCVTATDTFSADGKVVLLERGTKLIGETRGQVQTGGSRVFVLWDEARTPTGVVVPLDSPATDELGRSGLTGRVERHFWERFGAAILISIIDGAVQAEAQRSGGGAVIVNPSGSQQIATEVLKGTLAIAPTVLKSQGDRIQILVARDIDFRPVYELRAAAGQR